MTEYDIYPVPDLATHPPLWTSAWNTLHLRLKHDFVKALNPSFFSSSSSSLSPLQDHLLSPKMLSQHHLSCFVSLKNPLFSSLFSFSSHPLIPALPSSRHRAVNLRQWQTPTRKPAILIPLCISIMEQLDMRALLSGPSWLTACCIPSVNKEKRVRSGETREGERRGGGYGSVITAMGLMDVWGLNWLLMTAEASPCFYQLSAGSHPRTQSLLDSSSAIPRLASSPPAGSRAPVFLAVIASFPHHSSVSFSQPPPPPLTFYPPSLRHCSLFLDLFFFFFYHFCLNNPPTHQSPLHYFPLWIQFSRQHDVQIKECDGSWWKYTARVQ